MPDKCRSWLEPCVCEGLSSSRCWPEVGQAVRSEFPFSWSGTSSASLSWSSAFSSNTCATRTCEGVNEIFVVWNLRHLDGRKGEYLHLLTASSEMASLPCMAPGAALPNCSSLDFLAGASALGSRRLATWSKMRNSFSGNLFLSISPSPFSSLPCPLSPRPSWGCLTWMETLHRKFQF